MVAEQADATPAPSPSTALMRLMAGYTVAQAVHAAARLGLADLLAPGPRDGAALARATSAHPRSLTRLLRALTSIGLCVDTGDGRFALTALGEGLRDGVPGSVRMAVISAGEELYQAWGALLHSVQTGMPAFDHVFGVDCYTYLAGHPEASAVFDASMTETAQVGLAPVLAAYDFAPFGTVVDVGGGMGLFLAAVLATCPTLHGILFDKPHVVAGAPPLLEAAGVAARCTVIGGDMFTSVPAGGDAYLLVRTLLNWPIDRAVAILRRCREAMPPHGRLLVVEPVLAREAVPAADAFNDLNLLVMGGGQMCTAEEFGELFAAAGFRLERIVRTASRLSIVEGITVEAAARQD